MKTVTLAITDASICDSADTEAIERGAFSEGYNSSPGAMSVLQEMVADGQTLDELWADGFHRDNYDLRLSDNRRFLVGLLSELSADDDLLDDIRALTEGETLTHAEYWGEKITIMFFRDNGQIIATFPYDDDALRAVCV